jgi:hypothetical protein
MASANLPGPTLTAAERDQIVEAFGGTDAWLDWLTGAIRDRIEVNAATAAREQVNATVREAIEQATEALPVSMKAAPVKVAEAVEVKADLDAVAAIVAADTPE